MMQTGFVSSNPSGSQVRMPPGNQPFYAHEESASSDTDDASVAAGLGFGFGFGFGVDWLPQQSSASSLAQARAQVAGLVRRYARTPSAGLAEQVAACFANLAWHPEVYRERSCHCAYRGLVRHWLWLACQQAPRPN